MHPALTPPRPLARRRFYPGCIYGATTYVEAWLFGVITMTTIGRWAHSLTQPPEVDRHAAGQLPFSRGRVILHSARCPRAVQPSPWAEHCCCGGGGGCVVA